MVFYSVLLLKRKQTNESESEAEKEEINDAHCREILSEKSIKGLSLFLSLSLSLTISISLPRRAVEELS